MCTEKTWTDSQLKVKATIFLHWNPWQQLKCWTEGGITVTLLKTTTVPSIAFQWGSSGVSFTTPPHSTLAFFWSFLPIQVIYLFIFFQRAQQWHKNSFFYSQKQHLYPCIRNVSNMSENAAYHFLKRQGIAKNCLQKSRQVHTEHM